MEKVEKRTDRTCQNNCSTICGECQIWENLTIKELAAYLPYELKGNALNEEFEINEVCQELYRIETGKTTNQEIGDPFVVVGDSECEIHDFKPILFPLSSLTKEITINGETFVPHDVFFEDEENEWFDGNIWVDKIFLGKATSLDFIPYGMIEKLLEWKFDVFNLIERGLAISVTETFNPYK
jgi:hypothetical protein